jgi:hypothetical protein
VTDTIEQIIERLEKDVEGTVHQIDARIALVNTADLRALLAENAKLRKALEELVLTDGSEPNVSGVHTLAAHVRSVARAALQERRIE